MKKIRRVLELFRSLLGEISDENAYKRHLEASGQTHSGETWRAFIDRRHGRRFKNAKCC